MYYHFYRWSVFTTATLPQDKAEQYCENLRLNGLISTIEPAGGGGSSGGPEAS